MAINAAQIMYEDTGEAVPGVGSTESTSPVYSYLADGAVRQASGSGAFELLTSEGWKTIGTPQHAESSYYITTALSSPVMAEFLKFAAEHPDQLNREQQLFMQNPLTSLDSYGQGFRWGENNLYDNVLTPQFAGQVIQTGDAKKLTAEEQQAGGEFNYTESAEQQAARDDDDGFLGIALTVAAMVFAPYIVPEIATALGVSNTAAAAIYGGAKSLVTGGDIGDVLTGAVLSGASAELGGGGDALTDAADNLYAGGDWYSAMTGGTSAAWEAENLATAASVADPGNVGGTMLASAGGVTDVPVLDTGGMSGEPQSIATASPEAADAFAGYGVGETAAGGTQVVSPGGAMDTYGALSSPMNTANTDTIFDLPTRGEGIIAKWMAPFKGLDKEQATLLASGVVAGGNLVSGGFRALLEKSALEEKMQADRDLVAQKFAQETTGKRDFVQSNPSVFNWRRRFLPSGQPLRRLSTGQPVYNGGLIASRMRGG